MSPGLILIAWRIEWPLLFDHQSMWPLMQQRSLPQSFYLEIFSLPDIFLHSPKVSADSYSRQTHVLLPVKSGPSPGTRVAPVWQQWPLSRMKNDLSASALGNTGPVVNDCMNSREGRWRSSRLRTRRQQNICIQAHTCSRSRFITYIITVLRIIRVWCELRSVFLFSQRHSKSMNV